MDIETIANTAQIYFHLREPESLANAASELGLSRRDVAIGGITLYRCGLLVHDGKDLVHRGNGYTAKHYAYRSAGPLEALRSACRKYLPNFPLHPAHQ